MTKKETIKFFNDKELDAVFKVLEERTKKARTEFQLKTAIRNEAFFKIEYYCALRVSETILLKTGYFSFKKNQVFCKRIKGGINNTLKIIDEDILRSLKRHIEINKTDEYLFVNFHTGKQISRKTMDQVFRDICVEANIKDITKHHNHALRHTRAIYLAEQGLDLKELQYWLGHKHVANTLIYFQFTTKQQKPLYDKLYKNRRKKR